ncbi:MAG: mechanosensitive ion channel [Planctomycetia bacterium]|nr:mechanosensitive ion channel [Planctomycetia bacterium]
MPRMARIAIIVGCLACPASLLAEPKLKAPRETAPPAERAPTELTAEVIRKRLKQVEDAPVLDPTIKKSLIATYNAALEHLNTAAEHAAKAAEFQKSTAEAPRLLQRLKAKLQDSAAAVPQPVPSDLTLAEMQKALSDAEEAYEALEKKLSELQEEPERRAARRLEIPGLQQGAREQMTEVEKQRDANLAARTPADPAIAAGNALCLAHRKALEQELEVYDEELRHYELTGDLLEVRRDHALMLKEQAEKQLKVFRAAVNDRRHNEAEQQARAAVQAAKLAHPAIRRLAEENADLTARRQELVGRIEVAGKELETLDNQLDTLDTLFARITRRVKRIGLTESIGLLLRKQRDAMPDVKDHQRLIDRRKTEISKLSLQIIDLEDQRAALADIDDRTQQVLEETRTGRKTKKAVSEADVRAMFETMRGYLSSLISDTNSYVDTLAELDTKETQLVSKAREFTDYTNEYILWIPSAGLPHAGDMASLGEGLGWAVSTRRWSAVLQTYADDLREHPVAYLSVLLAAVLLSLSQRGSRKLLRNIGREAAAQQATSIRTTGLALLATLLMSVVWPAVLWLAGWRLLVLAGRSEFPTAVATAFTGVAVLLATINFTRNLCRSFGLGEAHFDWPAPCLKVVRSRLWWLTAAGLPLAAIVLMTESQSDEPIKNSLGRAAFLAFQLLVVACAYHVWHSPQGFSRLLTSGNHDRWWVRLCRLAQAASLAAPAGLAALAIVGYYYTAVQLTQRLLVTLWLVSGIFVVHAVLLRWLLLAYRDLASKRAAEQRSAPVSGRSAGEQQPEKSAAEPRMRLADINTQAHKLLGLAACCAFLVGGSLIWAKLVPALALLDTVQLWPHPFAIVSADATPDPALYTLSLGDLAAALLIGLVTLAAAKNIPGLLEITLLRHVRLDSGARYAVDAVTRYAITVVGLMIAFGRVGIGWKDLQWLVAAMTVGLGFGLQEIFANFASGLLLLFERPIRIGDTVSVGDIVGRVSRIRIRATTITDGDMRELIVPNKEFISGRVLNWTLSDTISRMTVKVCVPQGCDPDLVKQVLLRVATANPLVLRDPPPHALFDEFADDKLNFTLRVYMASRDVYNQLRHELNAGIKAAFVRAGIDKGNPQQESPEVTVHAMPQAA